MHSPPNQPYLGDWVEEAKHVLYLLFLVEDKCAIAVIDNGKTVGHVPKFLTKLTFFFLKDGGKLHIRVTGPRRYSFDLNQSGLE